MVTLQVQESCVSCRHFVKKLNLPYVCGLSTYNLPILNSIDIVEGKCSAYETKDIEGERIELKDW